MTLENLIRVGCFESTSEIQMMKSAFSPYEEVYGMLLSTIGLAAFFFALAFVFCIVIATH